MQTAFTNIDTNKLITDRFIPFRSSINENPGFLCTKPFNEQKNILDECFP